MFKNVASPISLAYLCALFILFPECLFGQTTPAAEYLYDSVMVEIHPDYTADITYKKCIRFNRAGADKYSILRVPVNQHIDFSPINFSTRLPDGRELTLERGDIETISDFSPRYYPESKTKVIYIPSPRAGAVAEIAYRLKFESLLYLPRFFRQYDIPSNNSYFEVKSGIPYAYYISESLEIGFLPDSILAVFAPSIPARIVEPHMPAHDDYQILIKPDSVDYMEGRYGFSRWPDVANFYNDISPMHDTNDLPIVIRNLADSLVSGRNSRADSLESLLGYVLNNIRYISMDIGRGEFKPLEAVEVLSKRYGDCKDQSALLVSLCRAVGFKADPALMTTREKPDVIIEMPWPGFFNHVITAVDTGNGYLFLDASQATCCFGNLPFSLRNRRALICGDSPFLEFTLTSPYGRNNDIDIDMTYNLNGGSDMRVDVQIEIFRDPAHVFHSPNDRQTLSNVIYTLFSEDILGRYSNNFRAETNSPDYIKIIGVFYENLTESKPGSRMLVTTQSPYVKTLRNFFVLSGRTNPYEFDYSFNVNETVNFNIGNDYEAENDSLVISFNERGLNAELSVLTNDNNCRISKSFQLFNYTLSADRYNRFADFLLIASQIGYNSIELTKGKR